MFLDPPSSYERDVSFEISPSPLVRLDSCGNDRIDLESDTLISDLDDSAVSQIRVIFLNSKGEQVAQPRFCHNKETIAIISDLLRTSESRYRKLAVSKLCKSILFKDLVLEHVLDYLSSQFSGFIASEDCPFKFNKDLSDSDMASVNFSQILESCVTKEKELFANYVWEQMLQIWQIKIACIKD